MTKRGLGRFAGDRRGVVTILFALLLPVLAGMMAIAVDVAWARSEHNRLLSVAEASALAGAAAYGEGREAAIREAKAYASLNHSAQNVVTDADVEFGEWREREFRPGGNVNALRVTATRAGSRGTGLGTFTASLFGRTFWDMNSSAVALLPSDPVCILVLHPTRSDAFDIHSDAQLDAPGCVVQVNSDSRSALDIASGSRVNVKRLSITGGFDMHRRAIVDPLPVGGAQPMPDPYAGLEPPRNNRCGGPRKIEGVAVTIDATFAFCEGLRIDKAAVTFRPGIYVIKDRFELENGASISGDGVMIYLEGRGTDFFFHSRTSFDLRAPTSGPYAGIVLWSDKANTRDHDIYSKFGARAEGTIYAPSSQVEFENDVVWEASCIRIVVSRLELDDRSRYASRNPGRDCRNNLMAPVGLVR